MLSLCMHACMYACHDPVRDVDKNKDLSNGVENFWNFFISVIASGNSCVFVLIGRAEITAKSGVAKISRLGSIATKVVAKNFVCKGKIVQVVADTPICH